MITKMEAGTNMHNVRFTPAQNRSWNADRHRVYYRLVGEAVARYRSFYAPTMADAENALYLEQTRRGREIAEIL